MMLSKKYKAFTLTETIFGLIISSVLIGVIYTVFTTFNKQFVMFQQQQLQSNAYVLFDATFKQDLYKANAISYKSDQLILENYKEKTKIYTVQKNSIIRNFDEHSEVILTNVLSFGYKKQDAYHIINLQVRIYDETINLTYQKKENPANVINEAFIDEIRY
ncbi:hypothetical protein H2O64_15295 [Kordia sp. YSTF-M3]|uniref:Prepilin-type N-terminal cleavage/methylation domain-containing protein n=1 Tax=Kordia aestuariivivens TaxID=2759037 RepID=A0ABR7QBT3_9FLAO|nr:hypothetical protein [Kordia aestuariivivens]MBC8756042.1 hypothetical protein [Kordia aestuariivivens]